MLHVHMYTWKGLKGLPDMTNSLEVNLQSLSYYSDNYGYELTSNLLVLISRESDIYGRNQSLAVYCL
jgi:hypothetical protein